MCYRNKIEETVRLSEKYAESVNAAAWIWQNCLFSDSATSSSFFFFLAVCGRACIFMARLFLRTCHWACYIALPAFLFRMASEAKNTPSDLTLSSWHSQAVKLTANGVWPSKWTGHNKPLTQGSPSVTAYVSAHSYAHVEKHTSNGQCAPHPIAIKYPYTHTRRHTPPLASTHISPLAGLNPAKPQPYVWPASHLSCKRASAGRRSWWAPGFSLLRQEQLWISDLNLAS